MRDFTKETKGQEDTTKDVVYTETNSSSATHTKSVTRVKIPNNNDVHHTNAEHIVHLHGMYHLSASSGLF
jgi:hypothetical protein